jgi:hypothetical protein
MDTKGLFNESVTPISLCRKFCCQDHQCESFVNCEHYQLWLADQSESTN